MKKIATLLLACALVAGVAVAATPSQGKFPMPKPKSEKLISVKHLKGAKALKQNAPKLKPRKVEAQDPVGDKKVYHAKADGIQMSWFGLMLAQVDVPGYVVWGADNQVWLKPPVACDSGLDWVKGTLSDDGKKVTVQYPQLVGELEGFDENYDLVYLPLYAGKMKKVVYQEPQVDDEGEPVVDENGDPVMDEYEDYVLCDEEDNVVTYTVGEDGSLTLDGGQEWQYETVEEDGEEYQQPLLPEWVLTTFYYEEVEEEEEEESGELEGTRSSEPELVAVWQLTSDINQLWTVYDESELTVMPEGVEVEEYSMLDYDLSGRRVKIAVDGEDVYVTNVWDACPNAVLKGTLSDGVMSFPSGQLLGINDTYGCFNYFVAADPYYYEPYESYDAVYDHSNGHYAPEDNVAFVLCPSPDDPMSYISLQYNVEFYKQDEAQLCADLMDPEFLYYEDNQEDYGQDLFEWCIPNVTVEGGVCEPEKVYFNVYINGELFTFYSDEYWFIDEDEMTNVPYGYSDQESWDLAAEGSIHEFYITGAGTKTCGVQSHYDAPNGKHYTSHLIVYDIDKDEVYDGVAKVMLDKQVAKVVYTDLHGLRINNPAPGQVLVKKVVYTDGTTSVFKVVKK